MGRQVDLVRQTLGDDAALICQNMPVALSGLLDERRGFCTSTLRTSCTSSPTAISPPTITKVERQLTVEAPIDAPCDFLILHQCVEHGKRLLAGVSLESLPGKRNYAMLAMLIGRGLRRGELRSLRIDAIQLREEHWVIADLIGKAGHVRTIPIPGWAIDDWKEASGIKEGVLFRSINK